MFVSYYLGAARAESALNCPACLMCVYARMRVRARVRERSTCAWTQLGPSGMKSGTAGTEQLKFPATLQLETL